MYDSLFTAFIAEKEAVGRSPHTIKKYRLHIVHCLVWLDNRPLSRASLSAYLNHLRTIKTPNTTANYFADMVVFCTWMFDNDHISPNPATRLKPRRSVRRMPSYSQPQIRGLLDGASVRDTALILAFLDTGLRLAEMQSLERTGVDWATGHFSVIGKGDKQRSGWFSVYALHAIKRYLATRTDIHAALWVGRSGPLHPQAIHRIISRQAAGAGIRGDVRRLIHSFRATFARNYMKQGGDEFSLAALLGHTTLTMTRRYAELAEDDLRDKKQRINPLAADIEEAA